MQQKESKSEHVMGSPSFFLSLKKTVLLSVIPSLVILSKQRACHRKHGLTAQRTEVICHSVSKSSS